jgi:Flp pilus assembly pilin Flp
MKLRERKGQSVLEYTIILAAIIAAVIAGAAVFRQRVDVGINDASTVLANSVARLSNIIP